MNEKEKIELIDLALRLLNQQVSNYNIKMIIRINNLLNENEDPTIKDILKLQ